MENERPKLAAKLSKETAPGVYDTRDIDAIQKWTEEISRNFWAI